MQLVKICYFKCNENVKEHENQGNMTPPKNHNLSVTESKEMYDLPDKEFKELPKRNSVSYKKTHIKTIPKTEIGINITYKQTNCNIENESVI